MRNFAATFVLLLFFIFPTPSTAEIKSFKIRNDASHLILIDEFEFTNTGHVSVAISGVSVTYMPESPPDPSRMGFFLVSNDALSYLNPNSCDLDFKLISLLFTFQNLSGQSSFNTSYDVTYPNLCEFKPKLVLVFPPQPSLLTIVVNNGNFFHSHGEHIE